MAHRVGPRFSKALITAGNSVRARACIGLLPHPVHLPLKCLSTSRDLPDLHPDLCIDKIMTKEKQVYGVRAYSEKNNCTSVKL